MCLKFSVLLMVKPKIYGDDYIGTGTLFIALFDEVAGATAVLLKNEGITADQARKALKKIRGGRTLNTQDAESKKDVLEVYTKRSYRDGAQWRVGPLLSVARMRLL